jgi:hypothetical protein
MSTFLLFVAVLRRLPVYAGITFMPGSPFVRRTGLRFWRHAGLHAGRAFMIADLGLPFIGGQLPDLLFGHVDRHPPLGSRRARVRQAKPIERERNLFAANAKKGRSTLNDHSPDLAFFINQDVNNIADLPAHRIDDFHGHQVMLARLRRALPRLRANLARLCLVLLIGDGGPRDQSQCRHGGNHEPVHIKLLV